VRNPSTKVESYVPAVQRELERMIAVGELKGGDRVNESALALKLGISRGPIREACRAFEQTGVLRSEINRGFFVREISMREALEIYDLRALLGHMVGRLAATSITATQLAALDALVERMEDAAKRDDVGAFYPLNVEFHTHLVACAGNHKLKQLWPSLENELHLFRTRSFGFAGALRASNYDHRAIVAALRAGDAAGAGRLLEEHIQSGKSRLLRALALEAGG
jgi:DNA-binding GntR family transcriptional regulator